MTTTNTQGAADLLTLIEAYAELRHKQGYRSYNANTYAAWQAVKDAIAGKEATHLRELAAYRLTVENLEREIAAQQPAPSPAPAGWKLVPVEPTEGMLKAADDGDDAYTRRSFGPDVQRVMQGPYDHYCAMLDAAPTAEADTQPAPVHQVNYSVLYMYAERKRVDYNDLCATVHEAIDRAARAPADSVPPPAEATNTKTHELLSTTVGLLMGYREGAARQPYKPGSVIAKVVYEVVDHLKDWPYPEPIPPAQAADSVLEDAARLDWLDQQCEAYGFQDIHEGNRWEISGPYANVRVAIDAERAARKQGEKQ